MEYALVDSSLKLHLQSPLLFNLILLWCEFCSKNLLTSKNDCRIITVRHLFSVKKRSFILQFNNFSQAGYNLLVDYIYLALYESSLENCSIIENKCRSFRDDIFCDVVSKEAASFLF